MTWTVAAVPCVEDATSRALLAILARKSPFAARPLTASVRAGTSPGGTRIALFPVTSPFWLLDGDRSVVIIGTPQEAAVAKLALIGYRTPSTNGSTVTSAALSIFTTLSSGW